MWIVTSFDVEIEEKKADGEDRDYQLRLVEEGRLSCSLVLWNGNVAYPYHTTNSIFLTLKFFPSPPSRPKGSLH